MSKDPIVTNYAKKRINAILALIVLLPALWITGLWIRIMNQDATLTAAARTRSFLEQFPSFVKDTWYPVGINLICSFVALVLAARSFRQRTLAFRILTMIIAMLASLVIILTLSMML
jgi:hypothetical protein